MRATWRIFADWAPVTGTEHAGTNPDSQSSTSPRRRASRCWRWPTTYRLPAFGQRVQTLHQLPVTNQGPCPVTTRLGGYDDGANRTIRAGDAVPDPEHEERCVQTSDGAESPGQLRRIPNRSVDDPQPDPRDILPGRRSRFPGEEKVVALDHGDREIVLPLFRWTEAQTQVLRLVGPPAPDGEDRLEERHQVRQIHPRDLARHHSEVETRGMADESEIRTTPAQRTFSPTIRNAPVSSASNCDKSARDLR